MNRLIQDLLQEEKRLKQLIEVLTKSLSKAPDGNLRISRCGKSVQYYIKPGKSNSKRFTIKDPSLNKMNNDESELKKISMSRGGRNDKYLPVDKISERLADDVEACYLHYSANAMKPEHGFYVRKCDEKLAFAIAQRDYDLKLLRISEKRLNSVQSLLEQCRNCKMEKVYDELKPLRRAIVNPRIVTDEKFAEKWSAVQHEGKSFEEGTSVICTNRGERVRSKSEKIIADMLFQKSVPYRYEAPFAMRGTGTVYPDFTVLNIRHREELYWEHFGMMDNREYCVRALRKIESYQKNGIYLGKKLIVTFETSQYPLETKMIERNITEYCLN